MPADRQHRVMYVDGEMAAVDLRDRRGLGPIPPSLEFILAGHGIEPIEAQLRLDAAGRTGWAWWPVELKDSHRVAAMLRDGRNPNQIARELGISKSRAYRLREQMAQLSQT